MRSAPLPLQILTNRLEMHMPNTELLAHSEDKHSPRRRFDVKSTARMQRKSSGFQPQRIFGHPTTKVITIALPASRP